MTSADYLLTFALALEDDRKLAVEMGRILDRAQAINIDFRDAARLRLQQRTQALLHDMDRAFHALDLSTADGRTLAGAKAMVLGGWLVCVREAARDFARALEQVSILDIDREPRLGMLAKVAEALDASVTVATELAGILAQPPTHERVRRSPLPASRRIANLAVRFLPWEKRQRYLDEYLSELHDLAQDESLSRRAQLAHAVRLLARTPALRFALRRRAEPGLVTSRPEA